MLLIKHDHDASPHLARRVPRGTCWDGIPEFRNSGDTLLTNGLIIVWSHLMAAYAVSGMAKKERMRAGSRCILLRRARTMRFNWSGPVMACLPTPWCFRWFQTCSSGLSAGEYGGRWNSCSFPSVEATKRETADDLWTGWPSTIRNTGRGQLCMSRCGIPGTPYLIHAHVQNLVCLPLLPPSQALCSFGL